jgi:hypothetical protein
MPQLTFDEALDFVSLYVQGKKIKHRDVKGFELFNQCARKVYGDKIIKEFDETLAKKASDEIMTFNCPATDAWITVGRHQLEKIARFKRRAVNAETESVVWRFGGGPGWRGLHLPIVRRAIWLQRIDDDPFIAITAYYADSWFEEDFDRNTHPSWDVFMSSLLADPRCPANLRESPELLKIFTPQPIVKFLCDPTPNFDTPNRMIAITQAALQRPAFLQKLTQHGLAGIASQAQH